MITKVAPLPVCCTHDCDQSDRCPYRVEKPFPFTTGRAAFYAIGVICIAFVCACLIVNFLSQL